MLREPPATGLSNGIHETLRSARFDAASLTDIDALADRVNPIARCLLSALTP